MVRNDFRIQAGGLSELQAKILLVRGFTDEANLLLQKDFVRLLKKKATTISYAVKRLRKKELLTKTNFLTPDGKVVFQKLKDYHHSTKRLRAHKILGKFNLKEDYKDFGVVRDKYLQITNSQYRGFRIEFKDCVILFYSPRRIVFYLPDVFGDDIAELYAEAYEKYILPLKSYLEQMFSGLRIDEYEICSVTICHLAFQNHPLAQLFKDFNVQYSSDRLEVDHSHGVAELETVNREHSVQDMDKILDYEKLVRGSFARNKQYFKE